MFKYLQRFPLTETNRYLSKAFKQEGLDKEGWVQKLNAMLDRLF